jgi:hypothetical protein
MPNKVRKTSKNTAMRKITSTRDADPKIRKYIESRFRVSGKPDFAKITKDVNAKFGTRFSVLGIASYWGNSRRNKKATPAARTFMTVKPTSSKPAASRNSASKPFSIPVHN